VPHSLSVCHRLTKAGLRMYRILIVEDHRIIATDLAQIVEHVADCTATVTDSAQEALSRSQDIHFDLALIDIDLGAEDDGIGAALALRERFNTRSIFVSAYLDDAARQRAGRADPFGFLGKPFVAADVVAMLIAALGNGTRMKSGNAR